MESECVVADARESECGEKQAKSTLNDRKVSIQNLKSSSSNDEIMAKNALPILKRMKLELVHLKLEKEMSSQTTEKVLSRWTDNVGQVTVLQIVDSWRGVRVYKADDECFLQGASWGTVDVWDLRLANKKPDWEQIAREKVVAELFAIEL